MRCVIADDSRTERARVTQILIAAGHSIVEACENGEQAVKAVKDHSPDVVILDVVMPRMTGDAAGQAIRAFSDVAIVFATKNSQAALQEIAKNVGAAISVKPYTEANLLSAIEVACGNRR
jgi:CheY-like chemotaxis protein